MDRLFKLTAAAALIFTASHASAFYAEPTTPPGTGRGGSGGWTYTPSTPTPNTGGRINGGSASVNVGGGKTISRPVSWGIGSGAGRAIARGVMKGGLVGVGWSLAGWAAEKCVHVQGGGIFLKCGEPDEEYLPGKLVYISGYMPGQFFGSAQEACQKSAEHQAGPGRANGTLENIGPGAWICLSQPSHGGAKWQLTAIYKRYHCEGPPASYSNDGRCPLHNKEGKEIDEDTAVDLLATGPLPPIIPPGITIPVDNPVWNPSPGPNPKPRPVVTPIGDPVPNVSTQPAPSPVTPQPGADPQTQTQRITWTQPAVEVVHSPTEDQPLRLEVRPIDVPVAGPNSRLKPETDGKPEPAPGGNTNGPDTGQDKPPTDTKPDDRPGLCEEYPDILACKELDEVDADEVPDREVPISLEMAPGFARAGQCPADKTLSVMGKPVSMSWRPICDLASGVRPVVIAFAALSAVAIVIGISRRDA